MQYEWRCTQCEIVVEITRPVAEATVPPETDVKCLCEVPIWTRIYSAPMQMKASYPDGYRRFSEVKEAAKLNREAIASKSKDTKKEIASEIRKLGVRVTND